MSRAFVRNDEPDEPPRIPPRAPLPPGVPNYVTPRGLELLKKELAALEAERAGTASDPALLAGRIGELTSRLATAQVVGAPATGRDKVRFGAGVTLTTLAGAVPGDLRVYAIVGVDEADAAAGRIAFTSPLAVALLGRALGDEVALDTPQGGETLRIDRITYETA